MSLYYGKDDNHVILLPQNGVSDRTSEAQARVLSTINIRYDTAVRYTLYLYDYQSKRSFIKT